jgi:hypothetical protein
MSFKGLKARVKRYINSNIIISNYKALKYFIIIKALINIIN